MVFALAAVVSCSSSRATDPLAESLITSVPAGYKQVKGPASGEMDRDAALNATIADPSEKSVFLRRNGYQQGVSRVWTKGADYITALVYDFSGPDAAKRFVEFEVLQLDRTPGYAPFRLADIPGSRAYVLTAANRRGGSLFCQGVWFTVDTRAYSVSSCGALPNNTETATRLSIAQYRKAT